MEPQKDAHYFVLQTRAEMGAEALDAYNPRWPVHLIGRTIEMACPEGCVLGHMFGDYDYGRHVIGLTHQMAIERGFAVTANHRSDYYFLDRIWPVIIAERLARLMASEHAATQAAVAEEFAYA